MGRLGGKGPRGTVPERPSGSAQDVLGEPGNGGSHAHGCVPRPNRDARAVDRRATGPDLRPERARTARTAAAAHAPDRSTSTRDRYAAVRPPLPGRVLATVGM